MMLVDPDELLAQLGFDAMQDIVAAAAEAVNAATPILATLLGTEFTKGNYVDIFMVPEPGYMLPGGNANSKFRLSHGFLTGVPTTVRASSFAELGSGVELDSVVVQSEAGMVIDMGTVFENEIVRVSYSAGFNVDGTDANMFDQAEVPAWLKDAAKLQAQILLSKHPSMTQAAIEVDTKMLGAALDNLVRAKMRYAPTAFLPVA